MTGNTKGRSLELFFIDGNPDGMLTAEVFNWTGHVLMTPRTQISEALSRKEANYTGIYILIGENEGEPLAYIGEGEDISDRIRNHDTKKDWWTTAILITSTANNLNKAHVKYLEARMIEEARSVGKITLENGNTPTRPGLSEAAEANMEAFIEHILMVLPALRIDIFLKKTRPSTPVATQELKADQGQPIEFEMPTTKHGVYGTAKVEGGEFIVQAGSKARTEWVGAPSHSYAALFEELVKSNILIEDGDHRVFAENYAFRSPSAAGAVMKGRSTNGPKSWRVTGQGKTYREWEEEKLSKTTEGGS
ncbi:MAG: GIY-YIG nuclease family protein [Nitrospinae bacterium]|nr:GIY-YIG nuclease family protein [Nitrospinota bacterium]